MITTEKLSTLNIDRTVCPLCGVKNKCAMEEGKTNCWCSQMTFPQNLPESKLSCFCKNCVVKLLEKEKICNQI